jgi:predicted transcriptional regulator
MPYDRFARVVEERAYDIEAVARVFGTSFEQTAHRFTTLGRSNGANASGHVPFFFIRVDGAGNVSKRLDGAGFPLPRMAAAVRCGACIRSLPRPCRW